MRVRALKPKGQLSNRIGSAESLGADEGDETEKRNGVTRAQLIQPWLFSSSDLSETSKIINSGFYLSNVPKLPALKKGCVAVAARGSFPVAQFKPCYLGQ